jgi:hypothetical protein
VHCSYLACAETAPLGHHIVLETPQKLLANRQAHQHIFRLVIRAARLSKRLAMTKIIFSTRKPDLFRSAFRFEDITYSAAGNSFAFHGIAPEDDFGVQLVFLLA